MGRRIEKPDTQIHHEVLEELKWDPRVDETEVGVEVDDGVVTLTGTAASWAKRIAAEEAVRRVAGVLDVANNVAIKPTGGSTRSDTDIARAVRHALEWDVFVPDERITSSVSDGWVKLEGVVERWSEREDAERAIRNLAGVKSVLNNILVEPPATVASDVRRHIEKALERRVEREVREIRIDVSDGVVTLAGAVASFAERRSIVEAARSTSGVRRVEDRLHVEPVRGISE
jgi:osmotically-inducible protein OsmY